MSYALIAGLRVNIYNTGDWMKVGELIKELKKLPKNLEVGFAHADAGGIVDGWIFSVFETDKDEDIHGSDMPDKWIALSE